MGNKIKSKEIMYRTVVRFRDPPRQREDELRYHFTKEAALKFWNSPQVATYKRMGVVRILDMETGEALRDSSNEIKELIHEVIDGKA